MRELNEIIVHCTATRPDWWASKPTKAKVNEVRRWHVEDRGWRDIGYHYLIDRDGTVAKGRPLEQTGAHTKGKNTGTVGIALFGGFGGAADDLFYDHFTIEQEVALRQLIGKLQEDYPSITKISGHSQFAAKACPTFQVDSWLTQTAPAPKPEPKPQRTNVAQSKTMQASALDIGTKAGAAITAITALDGYAQYIVLGFVGVGVLFSLWIMRERLKKWADGVR